MYTLDTNILIYFAGGDRKVADFIISKLDTGAVLYLPTIVVTEFFSYHALSDDERAFFSDILPQLHLVPLDYTTATMAADIRRDYGLKLGDSVIAATALTTNSSLVTRNTKDFSVIKNLSLESL